MNIILSNSSTLPIYEQIKIAIKEAIFSNELKEEEMLPSVRAMANELKISFLTVKRAYDELEQEGYIKTLPGKGSFVSCIGKIAKLDIEQRIKKSNKNNLNEKAKKIWKQVNCHHRYRQYQYSQQNI